MAGGYEFNRPNQDNLNKEKSKKLLKVFKELNYDLGVLPRRQTDTFSGPEKKQIPEWIEQNDSIQTKTMDYQNHTVGILIFPSLKEQNTEKEFKKINRKIIQKAKSIRPQVNILLGISTWGNSRENKFLKNNPAVLDILLGSGRGPHITGNLFNKNQTVWARPLTKGKTLNQITIPEWPEKGEKITWQPNKNIMTNFIVLNNDIPADSEISAYLEGN